MKLRNLNLTHYRGAENLILNLHPQLNVFIGMNGVGKSTILDSIAIMLSWVVNRIENPKASGRPITEDNITNGKSYAIIKIESKVDSDTINWQLAKGRKGYRALAERSNLTQLNKYTDSISEQIAQTKEQTHLPIFVYYPVNRAVIDIPLRIKNQHQLNPLTAYEEALSSGVDFRTFFAWFREREDLENENFKYNQTATQMLTYPDPQLNAVRQAIYHILPDFSNLTVRRNPLRMEVTKKGKKLTVNQLSDGEKCLIAMIGDLARRLAIANPENSDPLKGTGIILIDEIDLHLHPQWQRFIIPQLLQVFENCQFLLSTHSPHIVTHIQPENLHLLELTDQGIQAFPALESYGKTVERILEDLMGLDTTRPTNVDSALRQIYRKISDNKLQEAKQEIDQLKQKIKDDPDLTKAEVLILRKEKIGK